MPNIKFAEKPTGTIGVAFKRARLNWNLRIILGARVLGSSDGVFPMVWCSRSVDILGFCFWSVNLAVLALVLCFW